MDTTPRIPDSTDAPSGTRRRAPQVFLVVVFLTLVAGVPLVQAVIELARGEGIQVIQGFPDKLTSARLRSYERDLEDASFLARMLRPLFQEIQFAWLGDGGSKVVVGRDGWLFYRPGYESMLASTNRVESATKEAAAAIIAFRDALARRGIELLVVPAPNKESIYPDRVSARVSPGSTAVAPATRQLLAALKGAGVECVDLFAVFAEARAADSESGTPPLYLATDSHWSPAGVRLAAAAVARRLIEKGWVQRGRNDYAERPAPVERVGDVVRMMNSPRIASRVPAERVTALQVVDQVAGSLYRDAEEGQILVLGDSFLRIYERDEPGAAGFVAHLARELGQPLASLISDGGASTLVRQELQRRPALLRQKRVVIWEFVERDIQLGAEGWQDVPLPDEAFGTSARASLRVQFSFGHRSPSPQTIQPCLAAGSPGVDIVAPITNLTVGGGAVGIITADVSWLPPSRPRRQSHAIWQYLLEHGEPGQVERLKEDPGLRPDAPVLTLRLSEDGTRGFSIALEQLVRHQALWVPAHDTFITRADAPVDFSRHLASLQGERVLERVKREPEATWSQWTNRWEDVGNPHQWNKPWETDWLGARGHLVGTAARHGSLYKFGLDRWGNVRPDHGSPHRFRLDWHWPESVWAGQRITNGLPVLITTLERGGQRCEIEQFAAPLQDTPPARRGEVASVLLSRLRLGGAGPLRFGISLATESTNRHPVARSMESGIAVLDRETGGLWLLVEPGAGITVRVVREDSDSRNPRLDLACEGELANGQEGIVVVKLPSPVASPETVSALAALGYPSARAATVRYWEEWLGRGARFEAPEAQVNDLFRASLWHGLILPRHRVDERGTARMDLPYSNFAYGQRNADWPINQAVYVDYMLYGLRGYFDVAEEELAAMYQSQQLPDGRIGGYAEWGVYSPGMLYAVAQSYLLSRDRAAFERLLPASLKTLDWCLKEIARGRALSNAPGLVVAPLNDLTHEARAWAFPNAYFVAGLEAFGRALALHGHGRALGVLETAGRMRADVERAFARASVGAPVVRLADGTWINYVPCDALTPRRLLEQWYPTDVDCGPLHLARLDAVPASGWLAEAMLHDHEDNLFLNQWGAANEPVYNPQATAYLRRDEPEAAIRAFYSMMACAFSHHQLSPLEHRWAWGQYYGPPSTDGAWFELYRNMLLNELRGSQCLFIGQAVPRAWLAHGKRVTVTNAPTHFGPVDLTLESMAARGALTARVAFRSEHRPNELLVRLRHPERKLLRAATVNGVAWSGFDPAREWIRIPNPAERDYSIIGHY